MTKLNTEKEKLRKDKDNEIARLKDEIEATRVKNDQTVNEKCKIIKDLTTIKLQSDSKISELNALLTEKVDVDDQLRMAKETINQIEKAK